MSDEYRELVRVLGALSRLVVVSIVLERILAFLFEHEWFTRIFTKEVDDPANPGKKLRVGSVPGLKGIIALALAFTICAYYKFDILAVLFNVPSVSDLGILLTSLVLAGGSAGAIAIFQGFLNMNKEVRDQLIAARKAEAEAAKKGAEVKQKQAVAEIARAEVETARADGEKAVVQAQTQRALQALKP